MRRAVRRSPPTAWAMAACALLLAAALPGCSTVPVANAEAPGPASTPIRWRVAAACLGPERQDAWPTREALARACPDGAQRDFVSVAISGGGAKAAIFGGESLFYLDALGLLQGTGVLSTVSGGSFAGALYALSCDPGDAACATPRPNGRTRPLWSHAAAMQTLGRGYGDLIKEQVARALVPAVRASIGAERFAAVIDRGTLGGGSGPPFRFADLNPKRPHLVLNATITSENRAGLGSHPANPACTPLLNRGYLRRRTPDEYFHFAFTDYYFALLRSEVSSYPLAAGVAASAAFPVLIDPAVLTDNCAAAGDGQKVSLIDGGANDNQAVIELYMVLTELVHGQRRSDLFRIPGALERLRTGDRAFVLVVNSAVTESTGTASSAFRAPHGPIELVSGAVSKSLAAIDVYSAEGYNLRKQSYLVQEALLQRPNQPPVVPVEFSITGLDQYALGGTEAAGRSKAGIPPGEDDPFQALSERRIRRQERAYAAIVHNAAARRSLGLSDIHPQCYFDLRGELDASLVSLPPDDQACLREAARWIAALRAQEMCDPADAAMRTPDALACDGGAGPRLARLRNPAVLQDAAPLPGQCLKRMAPLMRNAAAEVAAHPDTDRRALCQVLASDAAAGAPAHAP